ncbi:MAG: hypothetical protein Q9204_005696 [Flavoplaca sp. TL-2023a]
MYHSSTVANNTLYVDGGELKHIVPPNSTVGSTVVMTLPSAVAVIDLDKPWNNADDSIWRYMPKPVATLATTPPSLNDGAIFSNGTSLWLYGGSVSVADPGNIPPIPPNGIWRYDLTSSNWSRSLASGQPVQRLVSGPYTKASNSRTFYLGGQKSAWSDPATGGAEAGSPYAVGGLLIFDEFSQQFQNVSTEGMNTAGTMFAGFLTFIPSFGIQGYQITDSHWPMQNISIFDIESQTWHEQQASGDIPSWRSHGCAVAVTAPDGSSHSIYVFGGWGATDTQRNDGNVFVLSIPSFTWVRVTLDSDQRSRHQCHLMGNHHMLVVGGSKPQDTSFQPLGLAGCDVESKFSQGLGIFSLNTHTWTTDYDPGPGADPYQIHASISKVIGGDATGRATKRTPDAGFSSNNFRSLMESAQPKLNVPTTNTTKPQAPGLQKPDSSVLLSKGEIAGIAVGVATSAILFAGTVSYILYRRRLQHKGPSSAASAGSSIPRPLQPVLYHEIYAAPAGQELHGGELEDNLARLYRTHEIANTAEVHEMPALSHAQAAKITPPDKLHSALVDDKYRKRQTSRQQAKAAKKQ